MSAAGTRPSPGRGGLRHATPARDSVPVDTSKLASAPNALRLSWTSAFGGDWWATVDASRRYARPFAFEGDALVLRVLADSEITAMIENHRTGLVWTHFMANPEIKPALDAIGFVNDHGND